MLALPLGWWLKRKTGGVGYIFRKGWEVGELEGVRTLLISGLL